MHSLRLSCLLCLLLFFGVSCKQELYDHAPDVYVEDNRFKVVGYLSAGSFEIIDQIELQRLTHLNLAFGNPDAQGELVFSRGKDISEVVEKAHAAGVKVLLSLAGGGGLEEEKPYWKKALLDENRAAFIEKIMAYVEKHNLDGVDVDIEGNLMPTVGETYTPFVLDLKKALHSQGKAITAALPGAWLHEDMSQEALEAYDFINIMVYDDTGPWNPDKSGPHSTYEFAERSIAFWLEQKKIPAERLVLGMPFYGYDFDVIGSKRYSEIVSANPADAYRDEIDLLYYNGLPTIVKKTQLAMEKVNGVMFWELGQDAFNDLSLLRAVDQMLKAGDCAGGSTATYFADMDADGYGDLSKPIQACTSPEGYVSNRQDCDDSDAAILDCMEGEDE
ncbi:glycosyl hydrolase family 18 protein [Catalinimonas niigatensis]|uniref:glycosyl hydrolase family 18 protein n=1 Tax=Catalinimonas niigatensis TaxID=1397264 RepID=UPI002665A501|nr:glycosyl hydrolase family 18 protein [Catalinimonas niigatensis]WPP50359.1 glycosyl hydrolase family 18 protein [Catalinimonas niigatensis]